MTISDKSSNNSDDIASHASRMSSYIDSLDNLSSFADFYEKQRTAASREACGIRDDDDEYHSPNRPASSNYQSFDTRDAPDDFSSTGDRSTLACNRLYRMGIQKEKVKAQNIRDMNMERPPSSNLDLDDRSTLACNRLYKMGVEKEKVKAQSLKEAKQVDEKSVRSASVGADFRNFDPKNPIDDPSILVCNRLYNMGVEKEKVRAQYLKEAKQVEEQLSQPPPKLEISTRSYTPLKARPYERKIAALGDYSTVHNYLYYLSKDKQAEAAREAERAKQTDENVKVLSTREGQKVVHRLYQRSKSLQHDGRERREKIAIAHAPKPQAPTKKISQDKATAFFDRQMAHKVAHEKKIADAQVNRPPRNNVRQFGMLDLNSEIGRNRALTPARGRSMTPDRSQSRARTPAGARTLSAMRSRPLSSSRSNTPSRGRSQSQVRQKSSDAWGGRLKAPKFASPKPQTRSASPSRNFRSLPN